uniref:Uncharacterized protein n=1 Tax=Oryza rufipogon TaxID=4529 RepID=A0A0E0Q1W5_ORYRU
MPKREEARGGVSHLQGRHGIAGGQGHLPRGGAPHRQRAASRGGGGEDGQQGKPYDLCCESTRDGTKSKREGARGVISKAVAASPEGSAICRTNVHHIDNVLPQEVVGVKLDDKANHTTCMLRVDTRRDEVEEGGGEEQLASQGGLPLPRVSWHLVASRGPAVLISSAPSSSSRVQQAAPARSSCCASCMNNVSPVLAHRQRRRPAGPRRGTDHASSSTFLAPACMARPAL